MLFLHRCIANVYFSIIVRACTVCMGHILNIHHNCQINVIYRGGSRISGKGAHMYKRNGGSLSWFYLILIKCPMKMK